MADTSWVDAYPLSFLPSLAQLSSIDRQPQASSRVPRPASQAPPSPLEPPLPRPRSPVRDARLRKKRPLDSREAGGRDEAVQRPRKRVEHDEFPEAATSDGGSAAGSRTSPRKGRRGRSRADSGAGGEAARSTHWEHDRHPRPANVRGRRSASREACRHVPTRQSEKDRRWAVRPLVHGGRSDETQFAARNPRGVDPLDDLSALVFEPVTSTAHAAPAPRVTLAVKGAAARSSSAAAVVAVSPRSASILPESTPRTLTDFSPPADHLGLAHFAELLLDRPTEPTWSNPLYDSLLSFFTACADPAYWTSRPDDLLPKTKQFHLSAYLTSHQPNKSKIQAAYRPGPESGFDTLSSRLQAKVSAMSDVMRWLWEDSSLTVSHVCGLVRHAPLSIFFLVREYSSVVRLSELVQHAERELRLYLFSLPLLSRTAHESAAEMLLNWLNTPAEPDRHYLFFCRPDGALRSEKPWEWWFDRAETSQSVQMWMLDAWEAVKLEDEDWEGQCGPQRAE